MLVRFTLENYKSFKDTSTLDFRSAGISELEDNKLMETPNELLKSISIIGANASGKSNLIKGLLMMRAYVINALSFPLDEEGIPVDPFKLSTETEDEPTMFEIEVIIDNKTYIYGIRATEEKVTHEWLFERLSTTSKMIFTRENGLFEFDSAIKEAEKIKQFVKDNIPFLSVGAKFNIDIFEKISEWFVKINTINALTYEEYMGMACHMIDNEEFKSLFLALVKSADIGISDVFLEKKSDSDEFVRIKTVHDKYDDKGKIIGKEIFDLAEEESEGTRKYFSLIGMIIDALISNDLLIIDELDARLHGDLVTEILKLYNSGANIGSQLLCVNMQPSILKPNLLRRDQVYLVDKDDFGASHVTTMAEYKIRKSQSMEKQYRDHKVGARPSVQNFEKVFVHEKI